MRLKDLLSLKSARNTSFKSLTRAGDQPFRLMLFYLAAYLTLNPAITASTFSAKTPGQTNASPDRDFLGTGAFGSRCLHHLLHFSMLTGRIFFSSLRIALKTGLGYWIEISP
jgi:hypothetical protein